MKINSRKEFEKYLDSLNFSIGIYLIIQDVTTEVIEDIYVAKFTNFNEDGSNWYLESPNQLMEYGENFEIESWQTAPFLQFPLERLRIIPEATEMIAYLKEKNSAV